MRLLYAIDDLSAAIGLRCEDGCGETGADGRGKYRWP
jgi:hypothetical protein